MSNDKDIFRKVPYGDKDVDEFLTIDTGDEMKKPFWKTPVKDWGVVNFLEDKVGGVGEDVLKNLGDVVLKGEPIHKAVLDVVLGDNEAIPKSKFSTEDIGKLMGLAEKDQRTIEQEMKLADLENQDRANAREAERARLKSGDKFIARFTYILALLMIAGSFTLLGMLLFVEVPDENETLVNVAFGVMFTTGLASVFQYYFGSTESTNSK